MNELKQEIQFLVGKVCWQIVAGRGNGSMVAFDIGEKIRRQMTPQDRNFLPRTSEVVLERDEFCIFVEHCAWRCEKDREIICTSKTEEAMIVEALKAIEGLRVQGISVLNDFGDCRIEFESAYVIELFCDQIDDESGDNYSVHFPGKWISVGPRGNVSTEPSSRYLLIRK